MWNISIHASRTLLQVSVFALCALPMHGQTANTGAIRWHRERPQRSARTTCCCGHQQPGHRRGARSRYRC